MKVPPRVTYTPKNLTAHTSVKFESKRASKEIGKAQYKDNIHSILSKLTASVKQSAKRLLDANNGSAKLQLLFNYKRNHVYTKKNGDKMYREAPAHKSTSSVQINESNLDRVVLRLMTDIQNDIDTDNPETVYGDDYSGSTLTVKSFATRPSRGSAHIPTPENLIMQDAD